MPADALWLEFWGVRAVVRCSDRAALSELERDFAFFLARPDRAADIELELRASADGSTPKRARWRWRKARVFEQGGSRVIDYDGRALLNYDFLRERGTLSCAQADLMHELAYLAVLSRVGARLDARGLHRVHALGFSFRGRGGLLLLPCGGGKSRLGLELLDRPDFRILGDDIPLLDSAGRTLHAFPLRLGLRGGDADDIPAQFKREFVRRNFEPKRLVDVDFFRERVAAHAPLYFIIMGRRAGGAPRISDSSPHRAAAALTSHLVLGVGTPQVLELMAPHAPYWRGTLGLAALAAKRAACAARASLRARCLSFELGPDARDNAAALERFLSVQP